MCGEVKKAELSAIGKMEVRAYEGCETATDQLVEKGSLKAAVKQILGTEMEAYDETGKKHQVDLQTFLVVEAIKNTVAKGVELKDVVVIQQLLGEAKTNVDVNAKFSVADMFSDIANK